METEESSQASFPGGNQRLRYGAMWLWGSRVDSLAVSDNNLPLPSRLGKNKGKYILATQVFSGWFEPENGTFLKEKRRFRNWKSSFFRGYVFHFRVVFEPHYFSRSYSPRNNWNLNRSPLNEKGNII